MRTVTTLITAIAIAASIAPTRAGLTANGHGPKAGQVAPESAPTVESVTPTDPLTLIGHTKEHAELVADLLDRYTSADLDLPPLTITFTENQADCHGHAALHHGSGKITVCKPSRLTIAHEIAHAWAAHNLTNTNRQAYTQLWDLPTWGSHQFQWAERATEKAANTIAWAVLLDNPEPGDGVRAYLCTYQTLTGNPLPHPLATPCPALPAQNQ